MPKKVKVSKAEKSIVVIYIKKGEKRSWEYVRDIMKDVGHPIDLRKASKTDIPLSITAGCCNTTLNIRRKKDFPLKDKWCKCGNVRLVQWIIED